MCKKGAQVTHISYNVRNKSHCPTQRTLFFLRIRKNKITNVEAEKSSVKITQKKKMKNVNNYLLCVEGGNQPQ